MKNFVIFTDGGLLLKRSSGAYRLATLLRQRDYKVSVIDFYEHWTDEELNKVISTKVDNDTVAFAFSFTWMRNNQLHKLVNYLQENYPGRKYIAGGNKPFQENFKMDVTVTGYVENVLDNILSYLFEGKNKPKGLHPDFAPNTLHINADLDYPAHSQKQLQVEYTQDDHIQKYEQLTLEVSRGCKFKCRYCCYPFLGFKESTHRDANNLREELIRNYYNYGVYNYTLADDTINDDDNKLQMLVDVVESLPFIVNFAAFVRMDLTVVKPQQLQLLSRARIWSHFYGIETFDRTAGLSIGKGMETSRIQEGMLKMREHMLSELGLYRGSAGLIAGLPHETPDSWRQTQQWMLDNWSTETWHWWPLDMTQDTNNKSLQSELSKKASEYGYTRMQDEKRIEKLIVNYKMETAQENTNDTRIYHHIDNSFFPWQNEHTDFLEATEFCAQTEQKMFTKGKLSNFMILDFFDGAKSKKELLDKLWAPVEYKDTSTMMPYSRDRITNYKNKMLGI